MFDVSYLIQCANKAKEDHQISLAAETEKFIQNFVCPKMEKMAKMGNYSYEFHASSGVHFSIPALYCTYNHTTYAFDYDILKNYFLNLGFGVVYQSFSSTEACIKITWYKENK